MASPADVDKYLKVKRLAAEGATPGERATALKVMERMETEDPSVKRMAELFENPPAQPSPSSSSGIGASWQDILDIGKSAFDNLSKAVSHSANVSHGTRLADHVEVTLKQSEKTGHVVASFRFPASMLSFMWDLSPVQQTAFRTAVHTQMDEVLTAIFEAPNEDTE